MAEREEKLINILDLKSMKDTKSTTFAGICARKEWVAGKCVTEKEYDDVVKEFEGSWINGGGK